MTHRKEDDILKNNDNIILVFPSQTNPYALADHIPTLTSKDKRKLVSDDHHDDDNQSECSPSSSEHISTTGKNNRPIAKGAEIEMTEIHPISSSNPENCSSVTQSTQPLANSDLPIQLPSSAITRQDNDNNGINQRVPNNSPVNISEGFHDNEDRQTDEQGREDGECV